MDLKKDCMEARIDQLAEELKKERKKNKELQQELKEANESITWWSNRYNSLEEENNKYKEVLDKIKEYTNKLIAEANMFAGDDIDYYMNYEYSVRDIVEYKKLLEEIE